MNRRQLPITLALLAIVGCRKPTSEQAQPERVAAPLKHDLCQDNGWCWVYPRPHGNDLRDVIALSSTDIWAVGAWGTIMHYDGASWSTETLGTAYFERVRARSSDDIWALGAEGQLAHRDATGWHLIPTGTDAQLFDVDWLGDEAWIVGDKGVALRWDGQTLRREPSVPQQANHAIEIIAQDDIWIGGLSLHHFDGHSWTQDTSLGLGACMDIHAFAANDVWCTDDRGHIYRRQDQAWQVADQSGAMVAYGGERDLEQAMAAFEPGRQDGRFIAFAPNDLYLAIHHRVLHWDGQRWRELWSLPSSGRYVTATTVTQTRDVYGVGAEGLIAWGQSAPWTMLSTADLSIGSIIETPHGGIIAIDGRGWDTPLEFGVLLDGELLASGYDAGVANLASSGIEDLWLPGKEGSLHHFDGRKWKIVSTGLERVSDVWVTGDYGWAAGDGKIARYKRGRWKSVALPSDLAIVDLWMNGPDDAWAIADEMSASGTSTATTLRWDGDSWRIVETRDSGARAIGGSDADHVWLGSEGQLLAWNGSGWAPAPGWPGSTGSDVIVAIRANAPDDLWVADQSAVYHYDGATWTRDEVHAFSIRSLLVQPQRIWIGGHNRLLVKSRTP